MGVVVDESRDHGLFLEVDHLRALALKLEHVRIVADGDDALPPDRQPLSDRETLVDGDDLAVHEDGVGGVAGDAIAHSSAAPAAERILAGLDAMPVPARSQFIAVPP